jgi:hypothetical protein
VVAAAESIREYTLRATGWVRVVAGIKPRRPERVAAAFR